MTGFVSSSSQLWNSLHQNSEIKESYKIGNGGGKLMEPPFANAALIWVLQIRCCETTAFVVCKSHVWGQSTTLQANDGIYVNRRRSRSTTGKPFVLINKGRVNTGTQGCNMTSTHSWLPLSHICLRRHSWHYCIHFQFLKFYKIMLWKSSLIRINAHV